MNDMRIRKILPEGFSSQRVEGRICIYAKKREREMLSLAGEGDPARRAIRFLRGRGRPAVVEARGGNLVVRRYYHGGVFRWLTGGLFFGPVRFLNELRLLAAARRGGAAVPEPAGLLIEPVFPFLARGDLVTVYIPESVDLFSHYRESFSAGRGISPASMPAVIAAAGRQVARLHRAGILHGDLQVKNILILPHRRPPEAVILDLDRGRTGPVGEAGRRANLWRLYRSFRKMRLPLPAVSRYDPIRFLRAYAPGERAFRRSVIARARRRWRRHFLHRMKWRLSFSLRGGYYARSMDGEKPKDPRS
jgi:3-deoxy-D-manno-octulosonic acid kinase